MSGATEMVGSKGHCDIGLVAWLSEVEGQCRATGRPWAPMSFRDMASFPVAQVCHTALAATSNDLRNRHAPLANPCLHSPAPSVHIRNLSHPSVRTCPTSHLNNNPIPLSLPITRLPHLPQTRSSRCTPSQQILSLPSRHMSKRFVHSSDLANRAASPRSTRPSNVKCEYCAV
jgi:hypothetical protein